MSRKDQILKSALILFNKKSIRPVTTNHISTEAGISPGNLYYHFRNKEEIILELFQLMIKEEERACESIIIEDFTSLENYFKHYISVYYEFRSLKKEILYIKYLSPELEEISKVYFENMVKDLRIMVSEFSLHGILRELSESETERLVDHISLLALFWLPYCEMNEGNS
ncbi:MAG: TetR/AcrR family transcriptional regulator, partial [Spirochaetaceae bacterium]|nr:TetR/AcrR family transcriptional regulator [Spirochaetaceae bacterium]